MMVVVVAVESLQFACFGVEKGLDFAPRFRQCGLYGGLNSGAMARLPSFKLMQEKDIVSLFLQELVESVGLEARPVVPRPQPCD